MKLVKRNTRNQEISRNSEKLARSGATAEILADQHDTTIHWHDAETGEISVIKPKSGESSGEIHLQAKRDPKGGWGHVKRMGADGSWVDTPNVPKGDKNCLVREFLTAKNGETPSFREIRQEQSSVIREAKVKYGNLLKGDFERFQRADRFGRPFSQQQKDFHFETFVDHYIEAHTEWCGSQATLKDLKCDLCHIIPDKAIKTIESNWSSYTAPQRQEIINLFHPHPSTAHNLFHSYEMPAYNSIYNNAKGIAGHNVIVNSLSSPSCSNVYNLLTKSPTNVFYGPRSVNQSIGYAMDGHGAKSFSLFNSLQLKLNLNIPQTSQTSHYGYYK